jgi:hypothetical protein
MGEKNTEEDHRGATVEPNEGYRTREASRAKKKGLQNSLF